MIANLAGEAAPDELASLFRACVQTFENLKFDRTIPMPSGSTHFDPIILRLQIYGIDPVVRDAARVQIVSAYEQSIGSSKLLEVEFL